MSSITHADGVLLSGGQSTSKDKSSVIQFGYIIEPGKSSPLLILNAFTWELEFSASEWENLYGPDIKTGSITPFLKYVNTTNTINWFIRVGVGVAYVEQTQWGNRSLGDNWLFSDKLEIGTEINQHNRIGLSLTHYSNARLNKNNDGTNIVSLNYSVHW